VRMASVDSPNIRVGAPPSSLVPACSERDPTWPGNDGPGGEGTTRWSLRIRR
jgi:hypothetical protein